ncbi:MAG: MATE family efflux transporter [Eubacterium sp.]|nr:MATE family efflux transporter [Eubacterium sp.]
MNRQINMLEGSLADKILMYALPLAATGILQQLFNAADVAVVGNFVGKEAMAAVGSNTAIIGLLVNLFIGISLGTNVVIAHAIGKGDQEEIGKAVHTSILVAVFGGIFLLIIGELLAPAILKLTGVPDEVFDMAVLYLRVYLLGMPVILLYNFESAIFRGQGNTRTPLIALACSGVINVVLNVIFVVVLHRTVDGVAMATAISNTISSIFLFYKLLHSRDEIRIRMPEFGIDIKVLRRILQIGVPAGIQTSMFSIANIIIQSAINSLGATVMAGSSAAFNLEIFAYYMLNSFGQACTTFVGQNYGAGKLDRCKRSFILCFLMDYIFTGAVCILILVFGHQLLAIFNNDPEVIQSGYLRLAYIFFAYIFSLWQDVGSGYLRGFGLSFVPAVISLLGVCGSRVLWIMTAFKRVPTFTTIMLVYPISLGLTGLVILLSILIIRPSRKYA